jgi:hypothetical protein
VKSGPAAKAEIEDEAAKAGRPDLPDAAKRALAEAEERRSRESARRPREFAGTAIGRSRASPPTSKNSPHRVMTTGAPTLTRS